MDLVFSGEASPVEQEQVKGAVGSRRKQRDCVSGKFLASTFYAVQSAGISCWRTKMNLQWRGEEERGGPIGDSDPTSLL